MAERTGTPDAVELTVDGAWFVAAALGAGTFPWVLAITPPYPDAAARAGFQTAQVENLSRIGVMAPDGTINDQVATWIRIVCFAEQWFELRYVGPTRPVATGTAGVALRGIIARRGGCTVAALRNAHLVTFTQLPIDHPQAIAPVLVAGLGEQPPARFPEFCLPARVGARADEQIRSGTPLPVVLEYLGIPASARPVVEAVYSGDRSYVEIVAGEGRDGRHATTEVGMSIVDTSEGRVLVSPSRAFDGEWISTFGPATPHAIAVAAEQLTDTLPAGRWFPDANLTRDFIDRPA